MSTNSQCASCTAPAEPVEMTAWRVSGLAKGDWP